MGYNACLGEANCWVGWQDAYDSIQNIFHDSMEGENIMACGCVR